MSTVDLLEEIQTLVRDRLQVEYVNKYGEGSKVIYALSGWLKSDIKYSSSLEPTWKNTEFIQSEELYNQPASVINCLRDNRFGGISNSSIQRTADGTSVSISCHQSKDVLNNNVIPKTITSFSQASKVPQARAEVSAQPSKFVENAKTVTKLVGTLECPAANEHIPNLHLASNKKKGQSAAVNTENRETLSRAPKKVNPASPTEETTSPIPRSDAKSKDDKRAEFGSSDDEGEQVNVKRSSQKPRSHKRRVVLHSSDEDEDEKEVAVNLSSPDVPKESSHPDLGQSTGISHVMEPKVDANNNKEHRSMVHKEKKTGSKGSDGKNGSEAYLGDIKIRFPESIVKRKANKTNPAPVRSSPKRKKVLKTHVDERGREVTEVIWEGEDEKRKSDETSAVKKTEGSKDQSTVNRPVAQNKKSLAVGSSGPPNPSSKAGNKKTGNSKDPKQGNIMSFFKRV